MNTDKVIYTDGRDVTVTDATLKVKNTAYQINGITRLGFWTIKANRWPGLLCLLLGLALTVLGWLGMFPITMNIQTDNGVMDINRLALWVGAGLALLGLLIVAIVRERYAVRIATAEGEKNVIVSYKREYIAQIVDALDRAFNFTTTRPVFGARKTGSTLETGNS